MYDDSGCSTYLPTFAIASVFNFSHGGGYIVVSYGLILHFPDDKQYQAFFSWVYCPFVRCQTVQERLYFFRSTRLSSHPRHYFLFPGFRLEVYFSK